MITKKLVDKDGWEQIPVYGAVIAGEPTENYPIEGEYEKISPKLASMGDMFAMRIWGDSMEPEMHEGDVIIVRSQHDCETGDTAVVSVGGNKATVKKIDINDKQINVIPLNDKYPNILYDKNNISEDIKIMGIVVELRKKYN
ncbi:MAG: hypothetical protein J1G06_01185 [Oscillospiraceae bacterium]|nr:hypothetical protein [Oscillospiraceae bacterium]